MAFAGEVARSRLTIAATAGTGLAASNGTAVSSMSQVTAPAIATRGHADRSRHGGVPGGDVTFDYDKATIRTDAQPTLDKLADLIKAQQPPSVAIEGHTDSKGDDGYNHKLSERRAMAVRDYLISVRTVDGTKLSTKGFGELRPVSPNTLPSGADDAAGRSKTGGLRLCSPRRLDGPCCMREASRRHEKPTSIRRHRRAVRAGRLQLPQGPPGSRHEPGPDGQRTRTPRAGGTAARDQGGQVDALPAGATFLIYVTFFEGNKLATVRTERPAPSPA